MARDYPQAVFVKSAARGAEFPSFAEREFCVVGRSNVGKSSFINHVLAAPRLARVSRTPGRTTVANFYRVGSDMCWVDLPGYGYARSSRSEKQRIERLMSDYGSRRESLNGVLWLVDVRHPGLPSDLLGWEWVSSKRLPVLAVLTKCDKVSGGQLARLEREHRTCYDTQVSFVRYSIRQSQSRELFWRAFYTWTRNAGR